MTTRSCRVCGEVKPATREYFHSQGRGRLNARCKPCVLAYKQEHYKENRDKISEYKARHYQKNRDRILAYKSSYHRQHRYKKRAWNANRRSRKLSATPQWLTDHQLSAISQRYEACSPDQHVDHIVPLQGTYICGLHVPWNLQIISKEENLRKSNSFDYWWLTDDY